MNIYQMKDKIV